MPKYGPTPEYKVMTKHGAPMKMNEAHETALADPILLAKIDRLFACNVGEYISLPQLVAVGDQSSGKSSVLEGLTGLSFPRDSGLCTRFVTQIIFCRMQNLTDREISASIIPGPGASPEQEQKLRAWSAAGVHTLKTSGFSKMIQDVHEVMGLSTGPDDKKPTFSNSVLRLEICGPDEDHLSVIDVPGIFKNTTIGPTTKDDMALVRNMVERYMANPRSIMLTVVPANVDIATQEIIEMAHELDPTGARTLGILTKPDLVDKGAEDKVINLIENGSTTGQLGWVLLRNLGKQELQDGLDRDLKESAFHATTTWSRVSTENYGVNALRTRLKELLTSNVRRVFPEVRVELAKKLKEATKAFDALGIERSSPEQQRKILLDIVSRFESITRRALTTDYGSSDIFNNHELRLATMISGRNSTFAKDMAVRGHEYNFVSGDGDSEDERQKMSRESRNLILSYDATIFKSDASRKLPDAPDIQEMLEIPTPVPAPRSFGIHTWIDQAYSNSRGFEIGTFNPTIVSTLFREQTAKWPTLGMGYVSDIIIIIHQFIVRVLNDICVDNNIAASIISLIMDELTDRYRLAQDQVKFLLTVEREGTLMTMNHYLNDNLQKCRQNRIGNAMSMSTTGDSEFVEVVRLGDIGQAHHMSNQTHTVNDIHDILKSYYKVARKRFVDSVCMQAADYYLVTGPQTPMNLLSPTWVNDLSNDKLAEIAGEDANTLRKRRQLRKQIEDLEAGKNALAS
ncbi:Dynamin [Penicillium malachiteum]|uniref:Dynamin n=1 Tax=Penicillium malachiteum TaxID=1324776 RepID=A0AAD6MT83_9EURO|nr:Dynamin [Penicillium malachiteum]